MVERGAPRGILLGCVGRGSGGACVLGLKHVQDMLVLELLGVVGVIALECLTEGDLQVLYVLGHDLESFALPAHWLAAHEAGVCFHQKLKYMLPERQVVISGQCCPWIPRQGAFLGSLAWVRRYCGWGCTNPSR